MTVRRQWVEWPEAQKSALHLRDFEEAMWRRNLRRGRTLFADKRGTRLKVLVHDGMGIWLAARRLHQGRFNWPSPGGAAQQRLQR